MAKTKYLIETSAVRPALGNSTAAHNQHFSDQIRDGTIWTSTYVRMEFVRRWFCDTVRMALTVDQCTTVSDALIILEQDFKPRNIKGILAVLAKYINETGAVSNAQAAEEIGSLALGWLKHFDKIFPSRIPNQCKCKIGGKKPNVDYNHLLEDLRVFYEEFLCPVSDCEVNAFLDLSNPNGRTAVFLEDEAVCKLSVGKNLSELAEASAWITCKECVKIGDAVIALEQASSWCLVHVDNSFTELCRARDRLNKQIKSVTAIENEKPN